MIEDRLTAPPADMADLFVGRGAQLRAAHPRSTKITIPVIVIRETKEWCMTYAAMAKYLLEQYGIRRSRSCIGQALHSGCAIDSRFHLTYGLLGDPVGEHKHTFPNKNKARPVVGPDGTEYKSITAAAVILANGDGWSEKLKLAYRIRKSAKAGNNGWRYL